MPANENLLLFGIGKNPCRVGAKRRALHQPCVPILDIGTHKTSQTITKQFFDYESKSK